MTVRCPFLQAIKFFLMFTITIEIRKETRHFKASFWSIRPKMRRRDKQKNEEIYLAIALMGGRKCVDLCKKTSYIRPIFERLDIDSFKEKLI